MFLLGYLVSSFALLDVIVVVSLSLRYLHSMLQHAAAGSPPPPPRTRPRSLSKGVSIDPSAADVY